MSINSTQMWIDMQALQRVLNVVHSNPPATLLIEPNRVALSIKGEYAWRVLGVQEVAKVLDRVVEKFYDGDNDTPIDAREE